MSRALAIETSSRIGSIALAEHGKILSEETFPHGLAHAAKILPAIDNACRSVSWTPAHIQHIYISTGPGSFTGLRIGITLAKTLAFSTGAKIVAVPSAQVIAENAPPDAHNILVVLDAKRDQIFTALFQRISRGVAGNSTSDSGGGAKGDIHNFAQLRPACLDNLTHALSLAPRPLHLIGEGIPYHTRFIPQNDATIHILPEHLWRPRAAVVAHLGHLLAQANLFTDPLQLLPTYIRLPEAQERLAARSAPQQP